MQDIPFIYSFGHLKLNKGFCVFGIQCGEFGRKLITHSRPTTRLWSCDAQPDMEQLVSHSTDTVYNIGDFTYIYYNTDFTIHSS